ncbi:MAG: GntR family transcriptional regulator [Armatimonadota bacterium]
MSGDKKESARRKSSRGRTLLYQEVADRLRQDMQAGFHPRGTYLPSEADLCGRFKVSRDTVRRALASLAAEGLIQTEPGVGHRVRGQVVSARQEQDDVVAVIAPYGEGALAFAEMVAGLERTLTSAGMRLVVLGMQAPERGEGRRVSAAHVEHIVHMRPHAVVCGLPRGTDASELQRLVRAGVPVIVVGEDPAGLAVDVAGTDDRLGAYMISEWLADWAQDLPWCVSGAARSPGLDARLEGYSLALSSRSAEPADRPVLQLGEGQFEGQVAEIADWAQQFRGTHRLGVLCTQADLLLPVARGLEEAGMRIGGTAALGCVGSLWQAPPIPEGVPVCGAVWSASDMGTTAAHLVIMRGVRGDARVPLRVLVAPRLSVTPEYIQPGILDSSGRQTEEGR